VENDEVLDGVYVQKECIEWSPIQWAEWSAMVVSCWVDQILRPNVDAEALAQKEEEEVRFKWAFNPTGRTPDGWIESLQALEKALSKASQSSVESLQALEPAREEGSRAIDWAKAWASLPMPLPIPPAPLPSKTTTGTIHFPWGAGKAVVVGTDAKPWGVGGAAGPDSRIQTAKMDEPIFWEHLSRLLGLKCSGRVLHAERTVVFSFENYRGLVIRELSMSDRGLVQMTYRQLFEQLCRHLASYSISPWKDSK
jgi:hypothetical protein